MTLIDVVLLIIWERAPSFNIAGSYFPDSIFCSLVGIAVAVLSHAVFTRLKMDRESRPAVLIYPCVAVSSALTLWLVFFS